MSQYSSDLKLHDRGVGERISMWFESHSICDFIDCSGFYAIVIPHLRYSSLYSIG
jgi:hypothetical protein